MTCVRKGPIRGGIVGWTAPTARLPSLPARPPGASMDFFPPRRPVIWYVRCFVMLSVLALIGYGVYRWSNVDRRSWAERGFTPGWMGVFPATGEWGFQSEPQVFDPATVVRAYPERLAYRRRSAGGRGTRRGRADLLDGVGGRRSPEAGGGGAAGGSTRGGVGGPDARPGRGEAPVRAAGHARCDRPERPRLGGVPHRRAGAGRLHRDRPAGGVRAGIPRAGAESAGRTVPARGDPPRRRSAVGQGRYSPANDGADPVQALCSPQASKGGEVGAPFLVATLADDDLVKAEFDNTICDSSAHCGPTAVPRLVRMLENGPQSARSAHVDVRLPQHPQGGAEGGATRSSGRRSCGSTHRRTLGTPGTTWTRWGWWTRPTGRRQFGEHSGVLGAGLGRPPPAERDGLAAVGDRAAVVRVGVPARLVQADGWDGIAGAGHGGSPGFCGNYRKTGDRPPRL